MGKFIFFPLNIRPIIRGIMLNLGFGNQELTYTRLNLENAKNSERKRAALGLIGAIRFNWRD